jgi:hypothetical protein
MKIELYYFKGCPSFERAAANLNDALRVENVLESIETVEITSEEEAKRKRFIGSPTIRIDGVDLEGPDAEAKGYGYGCRVYSDEDRMSGWPSVGQIRRALQAARYRR